MGGDAVGSQLALAFALDALGKQVRLVNRDPVPSLIYRDFPGVDRVELASALEGAADAVVLLECSDPTRPDVAGYDRYDLINIDHHLGNTHYGHVNWFDPSAAACGEMVADLIDALGVPWTTAMAEHLYLAIATDTGGFRHGPVSTRTFEAMPAHRGDGRRSWSEALSAASSAVSWTGSCQAHRRDARRDAALSPRSARRAVLR